MSRAALHVKTIGPLATLQDRGRPGFAAAGVPRGGAWDADTMRAALDAVGGADDDATIELPLLGAAFTVECTLERPVVASIDGAPAIALHDGATLEVPRSARAVRYLAVAGGLDVPRVLGARSTLTVARFGGLHGRPLRVGDRIPIGDTAWASRPGAPRVPPDVDDAPLVCLAHAGADPRALEALCAGVFRIDPRSDRVGTRLDGAPMPSLPALPRSRPLVRGAVQVPPEGRPIVIGPDGPTTGGYPVVAVLRESACFALARRRPGASVRFVVAPPAPPAPKDAPFDRSTD